jgi:hypothetical protein
MEEWLLWGYRAQGRAEWFEDGGRTILSTPLCPDLPLRFSGSDAAEPLRRQSAVIQCFDGASGAAGNTIVGGFYSVRRVLFWISFLRF